MSNLKKQERWQSLHQYTCVPLKILDNFYSLDKKKKKKRKNGPMVKLFFQDILWESEWNQYLSSGNA